MPHNTYPQSPGITFEEMQRTQRGFSDRVVHSMLDDQLEVAGERVLLPKTYFDTVPADESDKEFVRNPEAVVAFRNELTDMIAEELTIFTPPQYRDVVGEIKSRYLDKLEHDKQVVADYLNNSGKLPSSAFAFTGLEVVANGKKIDLIEGDIVGGVRSNIAVQENVKDAFVVWTGKDYLRARERGESPELTRRIYLNPRTNDAVHIFRDIMHAADESHLQVKGKIFDRSREADMVTRRPHGDKDFGIRGDTIVLYATDEEADRLLAISERVYKDNYDAFKGRQTSRFPARIAEGVAIGDQPEGKDESLTSHRVQVLGGVVGEVNRERQRRSMDDSAAAKLFRALWQTAAQDAGINPNNPAFNDHSKTSHP